MSAKAQQAGNIKAALTYKGSVKRWGLILPGDFGDTYGLNSSFTGGTISPEKDGSFSVAGTLEHPVTYQVRFGIGPENQRDITSEADEKITKANYRDVASDLTPDSDGYPPRQHFWAQDLTERHELVHAQDYLDNGPSALAAATTWLNAQTAGRPQGDRCPNPPAAGKLRYGAQRGAPRQENRKARLRRGGSRLQGARGCDQGEGQEWRVQVMAGETPSRPEEEPT